MQEKLDFELGHDQDRVVRLMARDQHHAVRVGFVDLQPAACMPRQVEDVGPVVGNQPVQPASLYLEQLRERLGAASVKNIGY